MGHAASPSLISLGLTNDLSQETAPLRWGVVASCVLHVIGLFLAFQIRFQSEIEQPFRAIEVALISLPAPQSLQPTPLKAHPKATAPPTKHSQQAREEQLSPLPTARASEKLSDSIGGAVQSIQVPSKREVTSPTTSPSQESLPDTPTIDHAPLVPDLTLPSAPPEISRPERLKPSPPLQVPQPKALAETKPPMPNPAKQESLETPVLPEESHISPTIPQMKPVPKPPTLNPATPFKQNSPKAKAPIKPQQPEKSLEASLKSSLPNVPPPKTPSTPRKKSPSSAASHPKTTSAIPAMKAPQLSPIPTAPPKEPTVHQQREKLSDSMKQLLAEVKAPSLQSSPPISSPQSQAPSAASVPSVKSEIDQQLAKLTIPEVAPLESITQRLQRIQVQPSSGTGTQSSKPSQGENRYLAMVEDAIDQRWVAPPLALNNQVVVLKFRIAKTGEISQVHMEQSSGNDHYDSSAFRAVQAVNPLPPFPVDLKKAFIDVSFRFIKQDKG